MKKRVLSMAMAAVMLGSALPYLPAAETAVFAEDTDSEYNRAMLAGTLAQSSLKYSRDMALTLKAFSKAAESTSSERIGDVYLDYGFSRMKAYNYGEGGNYAYVIGYQKLLVNGISNDVLLITARGTQTAVEGLTDFTKREAEDFTNANMLLPSTPVQYSGYTVYSDIFNYSENIKSSMFSFLEQNCPEFFESKHKKIIVTGHSLGGAAANCLGASFDMFLDGGASWSGTDMKDIYVYTYGAIKTVKNDGKDLEQDFENIHNLYNTFDSFGPNGTLSFLNVSDPEQLFGHTDHLTNEKNADKLIPDWLIDHGLEAYQEAILNEKLSVSCPNGYHDPVTVKLLGQDKLDWEIRQANGLYPRNISLKQGETQTFELRVTKKALLDSISFEANCTSPLIITDYSMSSAIPSKKGAVISEDQSIFSYNMSGGAGIPISPYESVLIFTVSVPDDTPDGEYVLDFKLKTALPGSKEAKEVTIDPIPITVGDFSEPNTYISSTKWDVVSTSGASGTLYAKPGDTLTLNLNVSDNVSLGSFGFTVSCIKPLKPGTIDGVFLETVPLKTALDGADVGFRADPKDPTRDSAYLSFLTLSTAATVSPDKPVCTFRVTIPADTRAGEYDLKFYLIFNNEAERELTPITVSVSDYIESGVITTPIEDGSGISSYISSETTASHEIRTVYSEETTTTAAEVTKDFSEVITVYTEETTTTTAAETTPCSKEQTTTVSSGKPKLLEIAGYKGSIAVMQGDCCRFDIVIADEAEISELVLTADLGSLRLRNCKAGNAYPGAKEEFDDNSFVVSYMGSAYTAEKGALFCTFDVEIPTITPAGDCAITFTCQIDGNASAALPAIHLLLPDDCSDHGNTGYDGTIWEIAGGQTVSAKPGDTLTFTLQTPHAVDLDYAYVSAYVTPTLKFDDLKNGTVFSDDAVECTVKDNEFYYCYNGGQMSADPLDTIFTFTVIVPADAPMGAYCVQFKQAEAGKDKTEIPYITINVIDDGKEAFLPGDADGNGVVNLKDVVLLRRFIAGGWDVTVDEAAADLDGSGELTLKDVVLLRKAIANAS